MKFSFQFFNSCSSFQQVSGRFRENLPLAYLWLNESMNLGLWENSITNYQMPLLTENLLLLYIFFNQFLEMCMHGTRSLWMRLWILCHRKISERVCVVVILFTLQIHPLPFTHCFVACDADLFALCQLGSLALWLPVGWIKGRHQQKT